jgi:hypothetical protein
VRRAALAAIGCFVLLPGASAASTSAVRFAAVGDIAMAPSSGSAHFMSRIARALEGDVVFGNLEGTLAAGGESKCRPASKDCFAFRAPPSYAAVLRSAGFTILNLANNHAADYGAEGQAETIAALRRAHLRYTGRPGQISYTRVGSTLIATIGFAPYPWAQDLVDIPSARRLVAIAASRADVVVVAMHAGAEGADHTHVRPGTEFFLGENRGNPVAFSHAVVEAGADLVLGSGPHVLRGLEWYRGRLIAYSLGNFLGDGTLSMSGTNGVSAVLQVALRPDCSWLNGRLVPVRLVPPGLPARDPRREASRLVRSLSLADFGERAVGVSADGTLLPPA